MVAKCPAKCAKIRLREKTPTLRCGKYAGYSVRDVFQDQNYWQRLVAHNPIKFLGSLSRFIEIDAREQQRLKQRLQESKNLEIMQSIAAFTARRKPVEKPSDYVYSGEEVIVAKKSLLHGMSLKEALSKTNPRTLAFLVSSYKSGHLCGPSLRDMARYVQQEYRNCRYHF